MKNFVLFSLFFLTTSTVFGQGVVESLQQNLSSEDNPEIFEENIKIIGNSKKIFVLTNNSQQLTKGDFLTLSFGGLPVARALTAKVTAERIGIKILKIYSLKRWSFLRRNSQVGLVRGDDSFLFRPVVADKPVEDTAEEDDFESKILEEDDLYDNDLLVEDLSLKDEQKRHIKTDNMVSLSYASFNGKDFNGDSKNYTQFTGSWAYQFFDNYYLEGLYGRVMLDQFPAPDISSAANNFTVRFKYIFKAPFYSFILPYVGYQVVSVDSPEAGVNSANAEQELALVDEVAKRNIIFGVTLLRRLVPGWFLRVDLGTDLLSLGASIEF